MHVLQILIKEDYGTNYERHTRHGHPKTAEERPHCNPGEQTESRIERVGEGWGDHKTDVPLRLIVSFTGAISN